MSDVIKWALLAAGIVAILALILALPFVSYLDFGKVTAGVNTIVTVCSDFFRIVRGLINNFFSPFGRGCLTGLLFYLFGKWAITAGIKVTTGLYHFIFK